MLPNLQFLADFVTFTEEIHFLSSVCNNMMQIVRGKYFSKMETFHIIGDPFTCQYYTEAATSCVL